MTFLYTIRFLPSPLSQGVKHFLSFPTPVFALMLPPTVQVLHFYRYCLTSHIFTSHLSRSTSVQLVMFCRFVLPCTFPPSTFLSALLQNAHQWYSSWSTGQPNSSCCPRISSTETGMCRSINQLLPHKQQLPQTCNRRGLGSPASKNYLAFYQSRLLSYLINNHQQPN